MWLYYTNGVYYKYFTFNQVPPNWQEGTKRDLLKKYKENIMAGFYDFENVDEALKDDVRRELEEAGYEFS